MKKIRNTLILLTLTILTSLPALAQKEQVLHLKNFQATLFPPVGTNGNEGQDYVNKISLNILWGSNAGLMGVEFGGLMNFESQFVSGAQFAGFANFVKGDLIGLSCSGFMNTAWSVKGVQLTHFLNLAHDVKGAQVSNFLNIAHKVNGVQVGLINVADKYESGVPLGIINIVKDGYRAWEVGSGEFWNLQVGYRMGIDKFYTQLTAAASWKREQDFLGFGFGVGSRFDIIRHIKGSVDLIDFVLVAPGMERMGDNQPMMGGGGRMDPMGGHMMGERKRPARLEQLRFTLDGRILRHLRWFAGPSFNLLVAPYRYPEFDFTGHLENRMMYSKTSGLNSVRMWPGFSFGIRF